MSDALTSLEASRKRNNYRRYNPLLDEWVIVAANRVNRPWQGARTDSGKKDTSTGFQTSTETNSLAPGGLRANGTITPQYESVYVFNNDFPCFTDFDGKKQEGGESEQDDDELFRQEEVRGVCRVICYHPHSEKSIALMDQNEARNVVKLWLDQFAELSARWKWVQIFENRGAAVGSSNSHPHGQIWAGDFLPSLPARKDKAQKAYFSSHGRPLLVDYLQKEEQKNERIVLQNDHWTVLVPFWALWPFETMVLPRRHIKRLGELSEAEQDSLAEILRALMIKYDNIFQARSVVTEWATCPFAFGMGWLGAPTGPCLNDNEDYSHWQLHLLIHPPLLRSATVPKFMAGYEILAEPQRDITPEAAAKTIRDQPDVHYNSIEK